MKSLITIESLTKKGKTKYTVKTSEDSVTVSEDDVVKYRILKGATFTEEEWESIKKGVTKANAWDKVLNFLSYQERSKKEIRDYLQKLKVVDAEIEEIIIRLESLDFINDERFAYNLVNSYKKSNKGPNFIGEKLKQKGISETVILKALNNYSPVEEKEVISQIIKKMQLVKNSYPVKKQKQLIYEKLLRDGFSMELVMEALSKTDFDSNHHERLHRDFKKIIEKEDNEAKIITKLMQKGYEYSEIKSLLDDLST